MSSWDHLRGVPKIRGTFLGGTCLEGPQNKSYTILGSIWGPPVYGNYQVNLGSLPVQSTIWADVG